MRVKDQPPIIWFAQPGADEATFLPLPTGSSYSKLASSTCVLLKSESARSSRQLWISVGVRLFVVLKPPPVAAPVGSIDMSSMDRRGYWRRLEHDEQPHTDRKSTRLNSSHPS